MKVKELVERVQSLYSRGAPSDDSRLSNRLIYNKLLSVRSLLIFQKINKKQKLSDWNYSYLECIELIKVPLADCPCVPSDGCVILRTKNKIPNPLSSIERPIVKDVLTLRGEEIVESTLKSVNKPSGYKFSKNVDKYFFKNEYIYIMTNKPGLKLISLSGIFQDFMDVENFEDFCNSPKRNICPDPLELNFNIDADLIEALIQISVEELVVFFQRGQENRVNNSNEQ